MLLKIRSVKFRLISLFSLIVLLTLLLSTFFFYNRINSILSNVTKVYLESEINTAIDIIKKEQYSQKSIIEFLSHQTITYKGPYSIKYALFNDVGNLLSASSSFIYDLSSLQSLINNKNSISSLITADFYYLTTSFKSKDVNYYLQFRIYPEGHIEALKAFKQTIISSIPAVILIIGLSSYLLFIIVFTPIKRLFKIVSSSDINNYQFENISEFKLIENLFFDALNKSEESYERILSFTSDVSHELRLPITAMKGEALLGIEKERTIPEYQKILTSIVEDLDRLMSIINRLLKIMRTDSNLDIVNQEKIDIVDLIQNIVEYFEVLAIEKNIGIQFVSDENKLYIDADKEMLNEIFINLIDNGIKYNNAGGKVVIELSHDEKNITIKVSDSGIGIDEDDYQKIFNRFYRVNKSRTRESSGFGLGLSIVKGFIKAHKGNIELESQIGKGTTFIVTLPINQV